MLKRILVPGLFGIAMYFAVLGGEYSVFDVQTARTEQVDEMKRLEALRAGNDSLRAWADLVESDPATIERLARERLGMIRTGEVLYRFADPTGEPARGRGR